MVSLVSRLTVLAPFQEHFAIHEHDPGALEKMWVLFQWTLGGTQAPKRCQCLEYHGIKSLFIRQNPSGDFLKMQILGPLPGASECNPRVVGLEVFVFNKFRRFFWCLLNLRTLLHHESAYISYPPGTQEESPRLNKCQGWRGCRDHPLLLISAPRGPTVLPGAPRLLAAEQTKHRRVVSASQLSASPEHWPSLSSLLWPLHEARGHISLVFCCVPKAKHSAWHREHAK